ncbi:hypothetical protein ACU4HD_44600 (plasmid) [Cupriavidus basilensis]
MAVYFNTNNAQSLLGNFDSKISQKEEKGKITTWEKSEDGRYYTHKAHEWAREAWFKPSIESNRLRFDIIKPRNKDITAVAYAYYHGHLIETFLNHFDQQFSSAEATALPSTSDKVA